MIPSNRIPTHPGQILLEEFLIPMEILQTQLAEHLEIPVQRINELVKGKRGVTPATAWLLAAAFQTTPQFWMNLQTQHDLARNRPHKILQEIRRASFRAATRARTPSSTSRGKGPTRAPATAASTGAEGARRRSPRSRRASRPRSLHPTPRAA